MNGLQLKLCLFFSLMVGLFTGGIIYYLSSNEYTEQVDITNTTCVISEHIGRRLFFHKCMKENKIIYDIRYFWKDIDAFLKAHIIGVQMSPTEFLKVCNYCTVS